MTDLRTFLEQQNRDVPADCRELIACIAGVCVELSNYTRRGALDGQLGAVVGTTNVQDEEQKHLDVLANRLFVEQLSASSLVAAMVSEEEEHLIIPSPKNGQRGAMLLAFDPLDGSSNIDTNIPVGSIFSVLRSPHATRQPQPEDFFQTGRQQLAAGYALYGQATMLVLTLGQGTHGFTLDAEGRFILTHNKITIPAETSEYAINASNQRFWRAPIHRYMDECLAGSAGPRQRNFTMRWVGSMVADAHRILTRGGVYLYPQDNKQPLKQGRLRLLYEANPMGMIIEQAGGRASDCAGPILDITPQSLHQRIGLAFGSSREIEYIESCHYRP